MKKYPHWEITLWNFRNEKQNIFKVLGGKKWITYKKLRIKTALDSSGTTEAWRHWSHAFKSLKENNFQSPGWIIDYRFYRLQNYIISSVQSLSCVRLFATSWTAACQASLSITNSRSPPTPISIESVMPSNHLILCRSLLLLPPIPPGIRVFSNESALHMR